MLLLIIVRRIQKISFVGSHRVPNWVKLVFKLYVNDITYTSNILDFILFADDTTILYLHKDINIQINMVNEELQAVNNWFKANKLSINASKINFMILGTPHMTSTKAREDLNVILDNTSEIHKISWCAYR